MGCKDFDRALSKNQDSNQEIFPIVYDFLLSHKLNKVASKLKKKKKKSPVSLEELYRVWIDTKNGLDLPTNKTDESKNAAIHDKSILNSSKQQSKPDGNGSTELYPPGKSSRNTSQTNSVADGCNEKNQQMSICSESTSDTGDCSDSSEQSNSQANLDKGNINYSKTEMNESKSSSPQKLSLKSHEEDVSESKKLETSENQKSEITPKKKSSKSSESKKEGHLKSKKSKSNESKHKESKHKSHSKKSESVELAPTLKLETNEPDQDVKDVIAKTQNDSFKSKKLKTFDTSTLASNGNSTPTNLDTELKNEQSKSNDVAPLKKSKSSSSSKHKSHSKSSSEKQESTPSSDGAKGDSKNHTSKKRDSSNVEDDLSSKKTVSKKTKVANSPLRYIDETESNKNQGSSYHSREAGDPWGMKAASTMSKVTGEKFRKEKFKMKRGSYKGGRISMESAAINLVSDPENYE